MHSTAILGQQYLSSAVEVTVSGLGKTPAASITITEADRKGAPGGCKSIGLHYRTEDASAYIDWFCDPIHLVGNYGHPPSLWEVSAGNMLLPLPGFKHIHTVTIPFQKGQWKYKVS